MKSLQSTKLENAKGLMLAATRAGAFLSILAISAHLPARAVESCTPKITAAGRTCVVSVADLNLSTATGMEVARERVQASARRLCSKVVNPWSYSHQTDYVACVDATMANALAQLQAPALAANSPVR
jgi:UrcA family protein